MDILNKSWTRLFLNFTFNEFVESIFTCGKKCKQDNTSLRNLILFVYFKRKYYL